MSPLQPEIGGPASTTTSSPAESLTGSSPRTSPEVRLYRAPLKTTWDLRPSVKARRTMNPVRALVDNIRPPAHLAASKPLIALSLGDPTVFGNLPRPQVLTETIMQQLAAGQGNGYTVSVGYPPARKALAAHYSLDNIQLTEEDVIIASGASGALDIAISGLLNEGDAILVPKPGFPLYQVITHSLGGAVQEYNLLPDKGWQIDLEHLESLIDDRTKAILVNNPSNPCGSVLPLDNLHGLLEIAERYRLPVITDEIYGALVFKGQTFYPLASLTTTVPIIAVGGIAKEFAVPGWRVGWLLIYDRNGVLSSGDISVRQGLRNLTQLIVGANTLVQSAIPALFPPSGSCTEAAKSLQEFRNKYVGVLEGNAAYVAERVKAIPALELVAPPQGAMYAMIKIRLGALSEDIRDDVEFCKRLLEEENVMTLSGQCFGARGYLRIVLAPPAGKMAEAMDRLQEFCMRHVAAAPTAAV